MAGPTSRTPYALERRALRPPCPRRRAFARSDLRDGLLAFLRSCRPRRPRGLRFVAPSAVALAVDFAPCSDPLLPRRDFFHARRAMTASLRACLASRRASLKRLRARFSCSLASRICWRATSARSFAVAKDLAGASSPCSFTFRLPFTLKRRREESCSGPSWRTAGAKSVPEFCDGVTAHRRFAGFCGGGPIRRYPQNLCITLCTNAAALSRDRKNTAIAHAVLGLSVF